MALLMIGLICWMPLAFGEEAAQLSLQDALHLAYEHNPQVAMARHDVEAALGRSIQARAYPNPELELSSTEIAEGLRGGSIVGDDSIAINQELDLLRKVPLRGQVAAARYETTQHALAQTWNAVVLEVRRGYNHLLLSSQRTQVAREVLEFSRRLLDQVQLRYQAGEAIRNELLRAQIEVAKAEHGVLEAEKQAILDTATLNLLLGREAQAALSLLDDLTYEPAELDEEHLLAQALAQRPDLQALAAGVRMQEATLQLARRDRFENPTVSVIGTQEQGEAGRERVLGLAVRVPLPLWNRNRGAIREATAELAKQHVEQAASTRQVGLEVTRAIAEARQAQRQVAVWRSAIEQANELQRLAALQYSEGDINFITYLEHLTTIRDTKLAYVETLATYRTQLALVDQAVAATVLPEAMLEDRP